MKIRSIRNYVMREQLKSSLLLIAAIFFFSVMALMAAIYFQSTSRAQENAQFLQKTVESFFASYAQQAQDLNRSQSIRSYLAYQEQATNNVSQERPELPDGVVLYDTQKQIYPQTRYARTLPQSDGQEAFVVALSDVQIGYFSPFYNFTDSEVLGYLCFVISQEDFGRAVKQVVPETVSFTISDSKGKTLYAVNKGYLYQREFTIQIESAAIFCTTVVDLENEYRSVTLFLICLIPISLLMLLVSILFSKRLSVRLAQPIHSLIVSIKHNEQGDLRYVNTFESDLEEIDQLSSSYQSMMQRLRELMDKNQKENLLRMEAQLGMLQEKINPHFLFNMLELISSQAILEDAEQTAVLTQKMGALFRYNLRAPDVLSLKRELQYVKDYLYLQNVRFNDHMQYEYTVDERLLTVEVPKLTIQPLLENCFKHGFAASSNKPHRIQLSIVEENDALLIRIDDDGERIPESRQKELDESLLLDSENFANFIERKEHMGLRNVNARLCLHFHIKKALWIGNSPLGGTRIELWLACGGDEEKNGSEDIC